MSDLDLDLSKMIFHRDMIFQLSRLLAQLIYSLRINIHHVFDLYLHHYVMYLTFISTPFHYYRLSDFKKKMKYEKAEIIKTLNRQFFLFPN